jgi:GxxExxY protein
MAMGFSELSNRVIGCAIEVHKLLGPGLLESTYQQCLAHELSLNHIGFKMEYPIPVEYKGVVSFVVNKKHFVKYSRNS